MVIAIRKRTVPAQSVITPLSIRNLLSASMSPSAFTGMNHRLVTTFGASTPKTQRHWRAGAGGGAFATEQTLV